jgi:hypothetical protein
MPDNVLITGRRAWLVDWAWAVFARANRKMWDEIEADRPVPWTQAMAAAARAWAEHREQTARS